MAKLFSFILLVLFINIKSNNIEAAVPDRTILFIMDGLCVETPERIPLSNFLNLKKQGCYYNAVHVPLPAHPKGLKNYPHTCSVPNPVMMTGNILFRPGDQMIQHSFTDRITAFITNSKAYYSVSEGFDIYKVIEQNPPADDAPVVEMTKEIIEKEDPVFMRVHLQGTGRGGFDGSLESNKDKPWYRNIWHPASLYFTRMKKSDRLLGEFVQWLESTGRLDKTVMIVTSDHGQAVTGGHPPYEPGSSTTPMLIFGPDIKKDHTFDYAEITDIVPTIAYLHKINPPENCKGRVLLESIVGTGEDEIPPDRYMERLNNTLLEQNYLMHVVQELPVTIEQIAKWHERFEDMKSLVTYSEGISAAMKTIANAGVTPPVFSHPPGAYNEEILLTISCRTDDVIIRYTTDDSEPTAHSTLYNEPIVIQKTTTIKAQAFKQALGSSYIVTAEYTISNP
ncbi:MAG: chitobiase/beta-hexosaminidase C-terminal domain-containing protein [Calditrichia bacterium]|nr:chitobiase/beta-hexosaminidase C-terminal domain-containing protein [Calditrichia bacterium]